jgi:formate dehydrogenase maturation protein FdhE
MAGGFWRNLFGTPPSPPPLSPEIAEALADLKALAKHEPHLADPILLLAEVLPQLYQDPIRTVFPSLTPEQGRAKLANGIPVLRGEAFGIDDQAFRRRWNDVCAIVERHQQGDFGQRMRLCLSDGRLSPGELLGDVLSGQMNALHARVETLGLDSGLTITIFRLLLIPVLRPVNDAWLPARQGIRWQAGFCPTCGNWPMLGEMRGEARRILRCGLCTADWELPAKMCPYCGMTDAAFLRYFDVPGKDSKYRAAACDACRCYLKTVWTLLPLSGPRLLIADLASMHLDLAAPERGYSVPE